jgi:hypothetical protein
MMGLDLSGRIVYKYIFNENACFCLIIFYRRFKFLVRRLGFNIRKRVAQFSCFSAACRGTTFRETRFGIKLKRSLTYSFFH